MSRMRALDADHDWQFGKGRNDYNTLVDAIVEDIDTRLLSFLGDCFFAINEGIDWFFLLGGKNQLAIELAVRTVILNTPEVTGIVSIDIDLNPSTRRITMRYVVNTIYTGFSTASSIVSGMTGLLVTESGDLITTEDGLGLEAE